MIILRTQYTVTNADGVAIYWSTDGEEALTFCTPGCTMSEATVVEYPCEVCGTPRGSATAIGEMCYYQD